MAGSVTTTRISLLEIGTDQNYDDEGTLFIPSGSTLEASGVIAASGEITATGNIVATQNLDISGGTFVPGTSTTSAGFANMLEGQLSLMSQSEGSVWLAYRSGTTVYTWPSLNTAL